MKLPSDPLLLALDTANQRCSVAVGRGDVVLAQAAVEDGYRHAEKLTVLITEVLREAGLRLKDMHGIVVSAGPGSYTGLRIGASVAKGLCYGSGLPLIGIDTLEMMARGYREAHKDIPEDNLLVPMIDARRDEVFTAVLKTDFIFLRESAPLVLDTGSFASYAGQKLHFFGSGAPKFEGIHTQAGDSFSPEGHEHARHLLGAALIRYREERFEDVAYFRPDYRKAFYTTHKIAGQ